ncbi:MAG: 50S ribosomal protein L18e [Methanosaeta sp. PtaB.Bin039]|nr:MAG: 50S ribosomal protein L18e [Methanosaeta sp. PtaB.Bin039]OPY45606.1 MAG: 50S ribosomal protein L18e [Methanosaeta sp. PtaU1.Bin028]HOT07253.1 50S ribosomal protein L18e [Methanotrichaceae archaeon]HQF17281.1 50S ribosomal protein L18e [Methanotrichaceae archaeon]HQI91854.1 50S ribosomal protein L18e [Methanotrichaceae archaeon]
MKTLKKTNPRLVRLIGDLKGASREADAAIWRDLAKRLEKPRRSYAAINLSKINRHTDADESILVIGKVLGTGDLDHKVTVAALSFSSQAVAKIESAGGKCLKIEDLMKTNPSGTKVRILR